METTEEVVFKLEHNEAILLWNQTALQPPYGNIPYLSCLGTAAMGWHGGSVFIPNKLSTWMEQLVSRRPIIQRQADFLKEFAKQITNKESDRFRVLWNLMTSNTIGVDCNGEQLDVYSTFGCLLVSLDVPWTLYGRYYEIHLSDMIKVQKFLIGWSKALEDGQ